MKITYTAQRRLAVSLTRGANRSEVGPGASARISSSPPTPRNGNTATARTMMPIPPNHCVIWRQNNNPGVASAKSAAEKMLDPEHVNPEIDSNRAPSNDPNRPVNR